MHEFHRLQVRDVHHDTRDSVVLSLDVPDDMREAFRFQPGQYLTFRQTLDGEECRRSYSICSALQDEALRVSVKRVPQGLFSTWANQTLAPGTELEVMRPSGRFTVQIDPTVSHHYLGIASGSGITPVLSILKSVLMGEPKSHFTLIYGNRATGSIMFREELHDLKDRFPDRFSIVHLLTRESQDIDLFNGRIDGEKITRLFDRWIDIGSIDAAFICGPESMMLSSVAALKQAGLTPEQIKFELFTTDDSTPRRRRAAEGVAAAGNGALAHCETTVIVDGRQQTFDMPRSGETVLDAGRRAGADLPYSCKAGVCSTCRAKVVEGEVEMDRCYGLEDYEVARGYILTCQSYPLTDRLVVDYDQ